MTRSEPIVPSAANAWNLVRNGGNPPWRARASSAMKPMLCRFPAYCGPGLPRPAKISMERMSRPARVVRHGERSAAIETTSPASPMPPELPRRLGSPRWWHGRRHGPCGGCPSEGSPQSNGRDRHERGPARSGSATSCRLPRPGRPPCRPLRPRRPPWRVQPSCRREPERQLRPLRPIRRFLPPRRSERSEPRSSRR